MIFARYDRKQPKYLNESVRTFCNHYRKLRNNMLSYGWNECTAEDMNQVFLGGDFFSGVREDIDSLYRANKLRSIEVRMPSLNGFSKVFYRPAFEKFEDYLWDEYEIDSVDLDYSSEGLTKYSNQLRRVSVEATNPLYYNYAKLESDTYKGVSDFILIGNKVSDRIVKFTVDYYNNLDAKYAVEKAIMNPNDYYVWRQTKSRGLQEQLDRVFLDVELGCSIVLN